MCLMLFLICDNILEGKLLLDLCRIKLSDQIAKGNRLSFCCVCVCVCVVEGQEGEDKLTLGSPFT